MKKYAALYFAFMLFCMLSSANAKISNVNFKNQITVKDTTVIDKNLHPVEIQPTFPGGTKAFYKFILANVKYPPLAKQNHVTGRVYVQFVVVRDGTLSNIKALRDPGSGLGDEALRVMALSPKWTPGVQDGRPVRVQYTVPINFSL